MSVTSKLANSIWPNGMDVDSEGYAMFYPLGTNKVDIPTNSPYWPKGDKIVSPFIYKNNKLVGFCDTKAMINNGNTVITMPYEHIEIELPNIDKDTLQIHAPKATTKKVSWSDGKQVDIDDVNYKYKGCKTDKEVLAKGYDNYGYLADIASDGSWTELLSDLEDGNTNIEEYMGGLFYDCVALTTFKSDLSSLTNGGWMFSLCENLKSFDADLSNLTNGTRMFYWCTALTTFDSDLSSLTHGNEMFCHSNISTFESELPNLTHGVVMFENCSNLTTFNCDDMSSLTDGRFMFNVCSKLTTFTSDLSSLTNGKRMFYGCTALSTFKSDLPSLTDGSDMFFNCNFSTFESDLSSLENGYRMFDKCSYLTSFSKDLSSLTDGDYMFNWCVRLSSFDSNLKSLTSGEGMFCRCDWLQSFDSDLSSLTNGKNMFICCYELTAFDANLGRLMEGDSMFEGCKLDSKSVKNIINTINTYPGNLTLGMGCNNTSEDANLFAQEIGYGDMNTLLNTLTDKGWTVTTQYNNRPTTTYGLRRPSEDTLPIYVKLEEVILPTEEEIAIAEENGERITTPHYDYTSEDDSKFFNIKWFHETTGSTEGYTQFKSLEEAIESLNIKPIERN